MHNRLNPRQFKKLCAKSARLLLRLDPGLQKHQVIADGDDHGWRKTRVIKGTQGFGWVQAGEESEWDDRSAWDLLVETVYWHVVQMDAKGKLNWPPGLAPHGRAGYLARAGRLVQEKQTGGVFR